MLNESEKSLRVIGQGDVAKENGPGEYHGQWGRNAKTFVVTVDTV